MIADGDLTQLIGPLTISELKYIIENEMVTSVEDVLVRRTRSAFLLEKEKLFKLIPVVCRMMVESKVVKLEKGETLEGYIEKTAERINGLEFS
jgi:glycerol-3-phosphate dehydrogenase